MPFVKREVPFAKMQRLLRGYGFNGPKLAEILGCSLGTARDRLNNPGHLTLLELEKINRLGHVPMEEIKNALVK